MTNSPRSASEVYAALHPGVQRWIYQKGWRELRPIQVDAARRILFADGDLIVAAPTAGGKTEAAFLPIASQLAGPERPGIGCLCVSPLKALINDQYERLLSLFEAIDRPVYPWHGDVSDTHKRRALASSSGTLLMTPESLEAMLVRRSSKATTLFSGLAFIVVDELHAFIGTERGRHVQSLLHRLEVAIGRRVRRVALSATLGDMRHAASCLRPGDPDGVGILESGGSSSIDLQVRGCIVRKRAAEPKKGASDEPPSEGGMAVVEHLFKVLRGSKNLVFANSRQRTEQLAALLRRACERQRLPNEFLAHHGSLSAEIRREAEARLKEADRPTTVLCTSTLELGIDVGTVKSVAQVGVPPTVASLRQRLGRSGRGTDPAVLRAYVEERELDKDSSLSVALRLQLVETIAMIDLLLRKWCEPQNEQRLHLSTLVHQALALVAERGGVRAAAAFRLLCVDGPFRSTSSADFGEILRAMGAHDLLVQLEDGVLALGLRGEREVDHYSFYAVFQTPEEFRVVTEGATLGALPMTKPFQPEQLIVFAGRWWQVVDVDVPGKTIVVRASRAGQAPSFDGDAGLAHDVVRAEMLRVLQSKDVPRYLDAGARQLLTEARATFEQYGLASRRILQVGAEVMVLPWLGDRKLNTLQLLFEQLGFPRLHRYGALMGIDGASVGDVIERLRQVHEQGAPEVDRLAAGARPPPLEKYDEVLPPDLARKNWISASLDAEVGGVVALLLGVG